MVPILHGFHLWAHTSVRIPSVLGSAFGFHLNKCQVHFVFKNNGVSGFTCPAYRSLPALPSFIEDIISSSGTDQVCKVEVVHICKRLKKKKERERNSHSPHP